MAPSYTPQNAIDLVKKYCRDVVVTSIDSQLCDIIHSTIWTYYPWKWSQSALTPLSAIDGVQDYTIENTDLYRLLRVRLVNMRNLITNGGGESGTVGAQATSWTLETGAGMLTAADEVHNGAQSLKVISVAQDSKNLQVISVTAGRLYELSGWIKTDTHADQTGRFATFFFNPVGGTLTTISKTIVVSDPDAGGPDCGLPLDGTARDWTAITCRFIANYTGTLGFYTNVGYGAAATATAWFDEIIIHQIDQDAIGEPLEIRNHLEPSIVNAGYASIRAAAIDLVSGKLRLDSPPSIGTGETLQIQGEYQEQPTLINDAALSTAFLWPDVYFGPFVEGLKWKLYQFVDDKRAGTVLTDKTGRTTYSGQLGIFMSALDRLAAAEDYAAEDSTYPETPLGEAAWTY